MIKGDKIRLIAPMGMFDNIGEICEVINVDENGVISFKFGKNGMHLGCMSYNEFEKYFELIQNTKHEWSEWKSSTLLYHNTYGVYGSGKIFYRDNGKKVQIKHSTLKLKSEATCREEDPFDFDKGFDLARRRMIVKILKKEVEDFAKTL